jgi:hypothetical protein
MIPRWSQCTSAVDCSFHFLTLADYAERVKKANNGHATTGRVDCADSHPLMQNHHKPEDEKPMVAILPEDAYSDWLAASAADSGDFLRQYPAGLLAACAV